MNRSKAALKFLIIGATAFFPAQLINADEKPKPPNIVIVLADDMGYGDAGCYNAKSKCPTPHIDSLAKDGMRFTDAHAAGSWCTPSRYGLLTGRYALRTSLAWRQQPVIPEGQKTIADVLQTAGYATAMVGKWHLGFVNGSKADLTKELRGGPCDRGFQTFFGLPASTDIPDYFWIVNRSVPNPPSVRIEDENSDDWSPVQGRFWRGGLQGKDFDLERVLDQLGEESEKKIDQLANQDRPFFLYVPLTSPHTPWLPAKEFEAANQAGLYSQFVNHTDAILGRVLKAIKKNNVSDNTLVIFTSDNGPVWYQSDTKRFNHDSMGGWRGMKGDVWEAGHRVPFVVRWPGKVPAKTVNHRLLSFVDIHATLASIAGSQKAHTAVDSLDFSEVWLGKSQQVVREKLVCFQEPIAYRSGDWKLITTPGSSGFLSHDPKEVFLQKDELNPETKKQNAKQGQLYHLANDPGETKNLWNEKPKVVAILKEELKQFEKP